MISDHTYTVSDLVDGEYLSCQHCDTAFEIQGDTPEEKNVHTAILLLSFKWQPCVYDNVAIKNNIITGTNANITVTGSSNISNANAKVKELNVAMNKVSDAIKKSAFHK